MSVASPSPLRGRWDCVLYVSECAHISVQVYYRRTSRFEQSCEPTDFCKAETISSQRTTEPIRRSRTTKSGGHNSATPPPSAPMLCRAHSTLLLRLATLLLRTRQKKPVNFEAGFHPVALHSRAASPLLHAPVLPSHATRHWSVPLQYHMDVSLLSSCIPGLTP